MTTADGEAYDASPYVPEGADLDELRAAAADCHGCPLYRDATQTVFGEGAPSARVLLVGEQPGDQEDRQGHPFVGPAGRVLERALGEAGVDPGETYVTNAVKHFKFTVRDGGKKRIHKPPSLREMAACRPWLAAEMRLIRPEVVVALGATAGKTLLGPSFRVSDRRGVPEPFPGEKPELWRHVMGEGRACLVATIHPSAVLRADDRDAMYAGLLSDLRRVADALR
ncbi:uracil-DNA glycosylase [Sphaerisporangium siamense]|uniref:Type-4 uracil-DNA glycosylase n=1 Tax=Sphaerisporangium siamense TaxID=795645 RepID=A0A7W7GC41_9ACTN|nr:UdgX family uracil-DNA binding protein [Sphaerisporangium siamense]MBB4701636.1 DNA polymerase [Sphaerisporangium siamense]GII85761.1 uracil-DNA glycosylase [Sphaerisporangium siamense]